MSEDWGEHVSRTCQITNPSIVPLIEEKDQLRSMAEEHKWVAINKSVVWILVSSSCFFFLQTMVWTGASLFDNWLSGHGHSGQHPAVQSLCNVNPRVGLVCSQANPKCHDNTSCLWLRKHIFNKNWSLSLMWRNFFPSSNQSFWILSH